uniref:Uncharacterized protein n=1 Tax=Eptatretus burgeri TaxID=7764 RepID=A0A8C4Q839_EPTBU
MSWKASQPMKMKAEKTGAQDVCAGHRGRKVDPRGRVGVACTCKMSRIALTSKPLMKQMDIGVYFGHTPKLEVTGSPSVPVEEEPVTAQQAKGTLGTEVMDAVRGEGVEEAAIAPPDVSLESITEQLGSGRRGAAKRERGLPTLVKKPSSRVTRQCPFCKKIPEHEDGHPYVRLSMVQSSHQAGTHFVDLGAKSTPPVQSSRIQPPQYSRGLFPFERNTVLSGCIFLWGYPRLFGLLSQRFHHRLYCSQIAGNLVSLLLRVPAQFVHTLPMDKSCQVDGVTVTPIEANHCPGSVMLLFELPDHTCHLHTGDFRASPAMEQHPALVGRVIHTLFLDTT